MWHISSSSLTRNQTQAPALGAKSLSHWTTREVPLFFSFCSHLYLFPTRCSVSHTHQELNKYLFSVSLGLRLFLLFVSPSLSLPDCHIFEFYNHMLVGLPSPPQCAPIHPHGISFFCLLISCRNWNCSLSLSLPSMTPIWSFSLHKMRHLG